jgi:hypothetical protein
LTKLATPIGEARNTLSFYLTLSTFGSPVTETLPDHKREGHPPRKGTSIDLIIPHHPLASL